ncbi:DUF6415 family natural product biosynthesis protein [Streptomyces viridosporus]|uniref:DUF6415 family natural product biosynthesis protein n=1 Tax=Streptomyces viridosporus TaxID=67581 RepID=UPI00333200F9
MAERLRGHLARLVAVAVAAEEDRRDAATAQLIEQARTLSAEDAPATADGPSGTCAGWAGPPANSSTALWPHAACGRWHDLRPRHYAPHEYERAPRAPRGAPDPLRHPARGRGGRPRQSDAVPARGRPLSAALRR